MPKDVNSRPILSEDGDCLYYADESSSVEFPENFYQTRTCESELINSHIKGEVKIRVAQKLKNTTLVSNSDKVYLNAYNFMTDCNINIKEGHISLCDLEGVDINANFVFLSRVRIIGKSKIDLDSDLHLTDSTWV